MDASIQWRGAELSNLCGLSAAARPGRQHPFQWARGRPATRVHLWAFDPACLGDVITGLTWRWLGWDESMDFECILITTVYWSHGAVTYDRNKALIDWGPLIKLMKPNHNWSTNPCSIMLQGPVPPFPHRLRRGGSCPCLQHAAVCGHLDGIPRQEITSSSDLSAHFSMLLIDLYHSVPVIHIGYTTICLRWCFILPLVIFFSFQVP